MALLAAACNFLPCQFRVAVAWKKLEQNELVNQAAW